MGNSVPGGWLIGRPANNEDEQAQAAAAEPKPANTQTSREYFVGTSEYLRPQPTTVTATEQPQPAVQLRQSQHIEPHPLWSHTHKSNSSGSSKEDTTVPVTSYTRVNPHNVENKRNQRSDSSMKLTFKQIEVITNHFSEEIGRGAFGQVFKGVLEGEEVAVKMLRFMGNINDKQFENEFEILKQLAHPNIVRLVGFCDDAQEECTEYNGKLTFCQRIHRALCLEYMPNGSLGKLLSGENLDKNWQIRYRIIKGTCKGLQYLQEGLEFPIFHLDLKPDNILLNEEMVPKISDFGLSRLIGEENYSKRTLSPLGTIGYLPPEFINHQVISKKYDIYSLGVIITKIITGIRGYSDVADMGFKEFVEHVHENWKKCLQEIPRYESLEVDCEQVKRCIEIARRCMENHRYKRPTIKDIVSQLDMTEMEKEILEKSWGFQYSAGRRLRLIKNESYFPEWLDEEASLAEAPWNHDPPLEICHHPSHPDHKLKMTTAAGAGDSLSDLDLQTLLDALSDPLSDLNLQTPDNLSDYDNWIESLLEAVQEEEGRTRNSSRPGMAGSETTERGSMQELMLGSAHKDPPSEFCHAAHPEHKLKLTTAAATPFLCDGCKEPGFGPRYTCDCGGGGGGHTLDLHTRCALAGDPLFGYGEQFKFRFLHEAPSSSVEGRRICDACGDPTRGYVYHCSQQDVDLHPCCASLPDRFVHDGRAFDLHRRASLPCALCPENEGQRRWFWAYRCYLDGEAIDLHVACLKETARRSWEADYRKHDDVGGGGKINVNGGMLVDNMFSSSIVLDKFGEVAGTLASFIMALVFGKLIVKM